MAKVRQPYTEPRWVPWLGTTVNPGQVVDVPDDQVASYLESGWEQVKPTKSKES